MHLLDLFSGTGSITKQARQIGWQTTSLDRDLPADIQIDIMDWDYKQIPPKSFDFIWASPPCTMYSIARTTGPPRDIEGSNKIVKRTLDIIEYFEPKYFCLENPQTGLLKDQDIMKDIPFKDIDYCKYGMLYRKRTRIWNNIDTWKPKPLCSKVCPCDSLDDTGKRHLAVAQRFPHTKDDSRPRQHQHQLYQVPSLLVDEILQSVG